MEKSKLVLAFEQELLQNAEQARLVCKSPVNRLIQTVHTRGGVAAVQTTLRQNRPSDAFASLQQANRLDLSVEASVVKGKYGSLFTDEEVNTCLTFLLDGGFFRSL